MTDQLQKPKISRVDKESMNSMLKMMIANDNSILPMSNVAPKIWFCDWYNAMDDIDKKNYNLYKEGEAVWINTEDLDAFTKSNVNIIHSKVIANSLLRNKYEEVKDYPDKLFDFYKDVVTGKITGNKDSLPLFYIGDQLKNTQIRVSLSNDNDQLPTNDQYWTDFFVNNDTSRFANQIIIRTKRLCGQYIERHVKDYHLSGIEQYWNEKDDQKHTLSDFYLLQDMSNLDGTFDYVNTNGHVDNGIDYVLYFHQKKFSDNCWKWFRVWKSGLLEHGGIVDSTNPSITQDALKYADKDGNFTNYMVRLNWSDEVVEAPSYTYAIDSLGFYYEDYSLDIGDKNRIPLEDIAKNISYENHYSVNVTQVLNIAGTSDVQPYSTMNPQNNVTNGIYYDAIDINSMTNSTFCFNINKNVRYYSYNVKGYSINSQQHYKSTI